MKNIFNTEKHTSHAVGSTDLNGSQVVEKLLEICMPQLWSPGLVWGVMEPVKDSMGINTNVTFKKSGQDLHCKLNLLGRIYKH